MDTKLTEYNLASQAVDNYYRTYYRATKDHQRKLIGDVEYATVKQHYLGLVAALDKAQTNKWRTRQ